MPEPLHLTPYVQGGKIASQRERAEIAMYLSQFDDERVSIWIEPGKRTLSQNRYYWAAIIKPIVQALRDAGQHTTSEAVHAYFKEKFLHIAQSAAFGKRVIIDISTTKLNKSEFSEYVERIKASEEVCELEASLGHTIFDEEVTHA